MKPKFSPIAAGPFRSIIAGAAGILLLTSGVSAGAELTGCKWNGIELWGDVEVVESFPDIKVQIVSSFPDLNVEKVSSFPDACGKWKIVESFPDFKVKFVDSFPGLE